MTETAPTIPNFLVAGAARSGTTSITETLRAHPDVFVTQPKEPHYFAYAGQPAAFTGPGDDATVNKVAVTDREQYLALYPREHDYVALGDGSVSTLYYHEKAVPEITALNPAMRIIIVLRDPVERAFSSYQYLRARGFEPEEDFRVALREEPRRVQEGWQHLWHYTGMSYYADAVQHFLEAFGRDQVGVWFYEEVTEGGGTQFANGLYEFLGLDPARVASAEVPRVNVSGEPRSKGLQTLIQTATRHESIRRLAKAVLPFGVRERIRGANLKSTGAPADVRQELAPKFRDDLRRLSEILDRPTPGWAQ
jgi:Sulfotransferase family